MKQKIIISLLVTFFLTTAGLGEAQQKATDAKLGFLGARTAASGTGLERLRRELGAIGHAEGKNISYESRYAENKLDRLPALAEELVRLKVDVLIAAQMPEALAAKNASRTNPIVFVVGADPVASGLVTSLARPGANITGFTLMEDGLAGKRLELLKDTIPKLTRVAVLWDPKDPGATQQWKESQLVAKELGYSFTPWK